MSRPYTAIRIEGIVNIKCLGELSWNVECENQIAKCYMYSDLTFLILPVANHFCV